MAVAENGYIFQIQMEVLCVRVAPIDHTQSEVHPSLGEPMDPPSCDVTAVLLTFRIYGADRIPSAGGDAVPNPHAPRPTFMATGRQDV